MPTDFEELKRKLLQTRRGVSPARPQHHDLDEKIHNLSARYYLTEPEQLEETPSRNANSR